MSLMKARNLPSMKTVLQRKSSFNYMPSSAAINATLRDNKMPTLDELPAQRLPQTSSSTNPKQQASSTHPQTQEEGTTRDQEDDVSQQQGDDTDSEIPQALMDIMRNTEEVNRFFDNVVTENTAFVSVISADDIERDLSGMRENLKVYHIKDAFKFKRLTSTIPQKTLSLNFKDCVQQIATENCMAQQDVLVRHYNESGEEELNKMTLDQFIKVIGESKFPMNVIDSFPPGWLKSFFVELDHRIYRIYKLLRKHTVYPTISVSRTLSNLWPCF